MNERTLSKCVFFLLGVVFFLGMVLISSVLIQEIAEVWGLR